jgi:retinol dehydrogenase 12
VALITGAGAGIGRLAALDLAAHGYRVLLVGRTLSKLDSVREAMMGAGASHVPECVALDLGDLGAVSRGASQILGQTPKLHLLINNAGVAAERGVSTDGFERTFAVNHLGHFALTLQLWPALRNAGHARVITVASRAHRHCRAWSWDSVRGPTRSLTGVPEYAQSKLANILFATELARRAAVSGVYSCSLHPGVLDTEIWRQMPAWLRVMNRWRLDAADAGGRALVHAALDTPADTNGKYFDGTRLQIPSTLACDADLAQTLWVKSLQWTQLTDPTTV